MRARALLLAALSFGQGAAPAPAGESGAEPEVPALGYRPLDFPAPTPGSYTLPDLGAAADAQLIDTDGSSVSLASLYRGRVSLLSLIYSSCSDANGCPLATSVLQRVQNRVYELPDVRPRVRLVTLSFDPEHDTPAVMARYAESFRSPDVDWRFLTARSTADLQPVLAAYQQNRDVEPTEDGRANGRYAHLLRVFLIDGDARIRNSYTVAVLHPDLILADIQTLLRVGSPDKHAESSSSPPVTGLDRRRDDRSGYEHADYRSDTGALTQRKGQAADLLAIARRTPLGLPPVPGAQMLTPARVELGRRLFYDRRLSLNGTFSCAMCHIPEQGFTSHEQATAIGVEGRTVRRNAPTIYNVAYLQRLFHDGRESSLENQVWGPLLAANEMANPSIGRVLEKVEAEPEYRKLFRRAFGHGPTMESLGQAIASYERTLVSGRAPFDRWHYGRESAAISDQAKRGFVLFTGKAHCASCHTIGARNALFTDQRAHNTGIGFRASMRADGTPARVQLAPGVSVELGAATIGSVAERAPNDLGLYEVTLDPADRWMYRTPGLRNVALTAPYMHDGSLASLREVILFYDAGGHANEGLDPAIAPLGLDAGEVDALVAFLESLTGDNIDVLVGDALAAPVGDPAR